MRSFSLFLSVALTLALPATSSSLLPRSQVCANDGKTKAGTLFHRRDVSSAATNPHPLQPRVDVPVPCMWCCPFTSTYIFVQAFIPNLVPQALDPLIISTLTAAWAHVRDHISEHGDWVIPDGVFEFVEFGLSWYSVNSDNHQQTWGVVKSALKALLGFMNEYGEYGTTTFQIFDGFNQVGRGSFGPSVGHDRA